MIDCPGQLRLVIGASDCGNRDINKRLLKGNSAGPLDQHNRLQVTAA
jgi:hypothetical protein